LILIVSIYYLITQVFYKSKQKNQIKDSIIFENPKIKTTKKSQDIVYIWKLVNENFITEEIYKIGTTTGVNGINRVKKASHQDITIGRSIIHYDIEVICVFQTQEANKLAKILLNFGTLPNIEDCTKKNKVRVLNKDELNKVIEIAKDFNNCIEI